MIHIEVEHETRQGMAWVEAEAATLEDIGSERYLWQQKHRVETTISLDPTQAGEREEANWAC
jgi:hypothetical protein